MGMEDGSNFDYPTPSTNPGVFDVPFSEGTEPSSPSVEPGLSVDMGMPESGKMVVEEKDTETDRNFKEMWNNVLYNPVSYKKDGIHIRVRAKRDESGGFLCIEKHWQDRDNGSMNTDYKLYKSDKGYLLSIVDETGKVSQMGGLSEDELQGALKNFQRRIDEGWEVKEQERERKRQIFDTYASNDRNEAEKNLEKELNDLT